MYKKRISIALVAGTIIVLAFACSTFAQMNGQGMGGGQGTGQDPMLIGEVASIDRNSVSVMTQSGENKQVAITSATSFVKQTTVDKSALIKGGSALVLGEPFGQNAIAPIVVIILEKMENMPGPRGQGGQKMQGQGTGQRMQGPAIGTITETDPLTIQQASGETTVARLTDNTRIFKETSISAADIVKGTRVRVIAPQKPGSGSREARKVIIIP